MQECRGVFAGRKYAEFCREIFATVGIVGESLFLRFGMLAMRLCFMPTCCVNLIQDAGLQENASGPSKSKLNQSAVGLVVRIFGFHPNGPGSIPGQRIFSSSPRKYFSKCRERQLALQEEKNNASQDWWSIYPLWLSLAMDVSFITFGLSLVFFFILMNNQSDISQSLAEDSPVLLMVLRLLLAMLFLTSLLIYTYLVWRYRAVFESLVGLVREYYEGGVTSIAYVATTSPRGGAGDSARARARRGQQIAVPVIGVPSQDRGRGGNGVLHDPELGATGGQRRSRSGTRRTSPTTLGAEEHERATRTTNGGGPAAPATTTLGRPRNELMGATVPVHPAFQAPDTNARTLEYDGRSRVRITEQSRNSGRDLGLGSDRRYEVRPPGRSRDLSYVGEEDVVGGAVIANLRESRAWVRPPREGSEIAPSWRPGSREELAAREPAVES